VALILLGICYFRMFSKNYSQRSAENQKYLEMTRGIRTKLTKAKNRIVQSKDYHIYKCPTCGQKIRIPRGKGRICITCPKCRHEFEKKS
jgi:DNA-directed RNA polymerase subunit RPC12/RpoP